MGWNYLSILKLQRCNRWSLGMDKSFHPTVYWACNYLSMLRLKLNYASKRGPWIPVIHCHLHCCVRNKLTNTSQPIGEWADTIWGSLLIERTRNISKARERYLCFILCLRNFEKLLYNRLLSFKSFKSIVIILTPNLSGSSFCEFWHVLSYIKAHSWACMGGFTMHKQVSSKFRVYGNY